MLGPHIGHIKGIEVCLSGGHIGHTVGGVAIGGGCIGGRRLDKVEFLAGAGLKPGPIKIEVRPQDLPELQYVPIKGHTPLQIGYMDGRMIKLIDLHRRAKVT